MKKVRAAENWDDNTYLCLTYVLTWLKKRLKIRERSLSSSNDEQYSSMWRRMAVKSNYNTIKIPFDQTYFDLQVNTHMCFEIVEVIGIFINNGALIKIR